MRAGFGLALRPCVAPCRQLAPEVFTDSGDASVVYQQPTSLEETRRTLMALVACPTGSIGTLKPQDFRAGIDAFPMPIAENIYFCGYTAESSFGAWSYLTTAFGRSRFDGLPKYGAASI